ncbi:MAG: hypothetical protein R3E10_12385 [Gemmatimonadota bacterium]
MGRKRWTFGLIMTGLSALAGPGGLSAQDTSIGHAASLEAEAGSLIDQMKAWDDAADLLREAAALRPIGDPVAVQNLVQAAKLSFYTGDEREALNGMEAAGERALNEGDVLTAATAFADAAWIASDEGLGERALKLAARAQRLAFSPLIGNADRVRLRERFHGSALQAG